MTYIIVMHTLVLYVSLYIEPQLQYALQLHAHNFFVSSVQMCAKVPQLSGCQQRVWHCYAKDCLARDLQYTSSVSLANNLSML